jgi:hypothetical protein
MADAAETQSPENAALSMALGRLLAAENIEVVTFAFETFLEPLMPMAKILWQSKQIVDLAQSHGMNPNDTADAIVLVGALRHGDQHRSWLAAEIVKRHAKDIPLFITALQSQPTEGNG